MRRCLTSAHRLLVRRPQFASPSSSHSASSSSRWHSGSAGATGAPLAGKVDRFGGVTVVVEKEDASDATLWRSRLRASVDAWRADGCCAVWVRVPNNAAAALPILLEEGFCWHHAKTTHEAGNYGYALLARWLLENEESRLPQYPTTQVGVGGVVLNQKNEVLLMQERISVVDSIHRRWKLPGGLADGSEDLGDAAAREVFEETGVRAEAEGILCIHHRHGYAHGVSDLYFSVRMRALTEELAPSSAETLKAAWLPLEEAQTSEEVMSFNRLILNQVHSPMLLPHRGWHGSALAKREFFLYAAVEKVGDSISEGANGSE